MRKKISPLLRLFFQILLLIKTILTKNSHPVPNWMAAFSCLHYFIGPSFNETQKAKNKEISTKRTGA